MATSTIIVSVFACVAYFFLSNFLLDKFLPVQGVDDETISLNIRRSNHIRPWLFLGPALFMLTLYLVYPVFNSLWLSFYDKTGSHFIEWSNYLWLLNDGKFQESIFNNFLWLLVVPAACTCLGLLAATWSDRLVWGKVAKSLIFMPMAISFVGASVIWKFVYNYSPEGHAQIGLLNAIVSNFGAIPQTWLALPLANNFFLMAVLIWIQTGFAMVILSAALRGIPEETLEAAWIDGASPIQIFFKVQVPQIWGTIAVVWTTITIMVLKVFDIVLAMTNGQWGTQVLANLMFDWMFRGNDTGRASAIALVLMILVTPMMIWNMRNARKEM